jgi:hypothetical protein
MKEVLTINVEITAIDEIHGSKGEVAMIHFGGYADCELFKGKIMPGAVDTQTEWYGEDRILSARYMLQGTDCAGEECRLFIENNSIGLDSNGEMITKPEIITDSKELAWLERADLRGSIRAIPKGIMIIISKN